MAFNRSEWDNRYKLTIDSSKVYEDLTDFPVSIVLSSGTGQTGFDVSDIFDVLTVSGSSYSNRKKIATTAESTTTNTDLDFDFTGESCFVQEDSVSGTNFSGGKVLLNNNYTTWSEQQKIQASDKQADDTLGYSVSIYSDTAIVGAHNEDTGGTNAGAAYIFTLSGTTWVEQQKIQSSDIQAGDRFGGYVSIYEDTAVVGAYDAGAGAAYIFTCSGITWTQQQKITASDPGSGDHFGISVSICEDTVIIGSQLEDTGASNTGAAYIFTRSGSTWTEQQKIQASDRQSEDRFGHSVDIYKNTVVVGAYRKNSYTGAAYIFTRSGTVWTQQQKIQSSDIQGSDMFGISVSIYADTVIAGARGEDTGGTDSGSVYMFTRSGSTWIQQQKIVAPDPQTAGLFGNSVYIYEDTIIVGAYNEDIGGSNAGAAYIFTRSGSTWTQQQKIQPYDIQAGDRFGRSVYIYEDKVMVGANQEDTGGTDAGAAYIFTIPTKDYSTDQPYYLHTSDTNNIPIYHAQTINSCTITNTQPEYTSIRGLISFDSRSTWKKWNGASWLTHTGGLANLQTGNTIDQIQTGLTGHHINGAGTYLDFAFDLATTYSGSTPEIDQITITYLAAEELYTEIANWDSDNNSASLWTKVPAISATSDTELRIYYDKDHDDNLAHVGDTSEALNIDYDMVVDIGSEGYYDTVHSAYPYVIKESDISYKMWYSGHDGTTQRIIYCTSTNGTTWINHQMVVNIGSEGIYDTVQAYGPIVIKESDISYKMWYSGHDGTTQRIIYCTSTNGTTWINHQMVVNIGSEGTYDLGSVLTCCVIKESDTSYKMWYTGYDGSTRRLIYCTSTDGTVWNNHQVVVNTSSEGIYDVSDVAYACIVKESNVLYRMWYSGYAGTNYRVIYCKSTNGITWTNYQMVINVGSEGDYDTNLVFGPSVIKDYNNKYQMWYTGSDSTNQRIIYTESYLPTWDRTVSQAVWDNNFKGVWHMEQDPQINRKLLYTPQRSGSGNPANAYTPFTQVNCTGITKENGMLKIDLRASNPSILTTGIIEITSAGTWDNEEWEHVVNTEETSKISTAYKTFFFPLSGFGDNYGGPDVSQIDFIRWYHFTTGASVTIYWENAELVWPTNKMLPDSTLNANYGIAEDGMTSDDLVDGKIGKSIDFDGVNDNIVIPKSLGRMITDSNHTLEAIVYPINNSDSLEFFCFYYNSRYVFSFDNLGYFRYKYYNSSVWVTAVSPTNNPFGTYYYAAGTKDGTNLRLYVDGTLKDTEPMSGVPQEITDYNFIGSHTEGHDHFRGQIDEVRISSTNRSSAWISTTYYSNWNSLLTFDSAPYTISGTNYFFEGNVKEKNISVNRILYLHRRSDGELIGQTTSSGGYFNIITPYNEAHYLICLDNEPGEVYNDLVRGNILPDFQRWSYDV